MVWDMAPAPSAVVEFADKHNIKNVKENLSVKKYFPEALQDLNADKVYYGYYQYMVVIIEKNGEYHVATPEEFKKLPMYY